MNETQHLIHCRFAWCCTHLDKQLLFKMLLLRAVTSWCDVSVCQVGTLTLFEATGINNSFPFCSYCYPHKMHWLSGMSVASECAWIMWKSIVKNNEAGDEEVKGREKRRRHLRTWQGLSSSELRTGKVLSVIMAPPLTSGWLRLFANEQTHTHNFMHNCSGVQNHAGLVDIFYQRRTLGKQNAPAALLCLFSKSCVKAQKGGQTVGGLGWINK